MKVVNWIPYTEAEQLPEAPLGGLGGWFGRDAAQHWEDYLAKLGPCQIPYAEALREECLRSQIKMTGRDHQESERGAPVFSDGTTALFSYRAWGDFMAAVWSTPEKPLHYMAYYC